MDAPKRIGLVYNGLGGWRLWDVNEPGMGGADRPHAEYILASEHDRLMAEKDDSLARLREVLTIIVDACEEVDCGRDPIVGYDEWIAEARAALGGNNG